MAMADWQQYTQSITLSLIFSFLLAKLFSIFFTFHHSIPPPPPPPPHHHHNANPNSILHQKESIKESVSEDITDNKEIDDDDWEGVECTELDIAFSAATAFVAAAVSVKASVKVSGDVQFRLYGLYMIATQGPCTVPQPSSIIITSRAKWNAWNKLGAMPPEEAMQKYLEIITELYPTWVDGSTCIKRGASDEPLSKDARPMGPVFSSFIHEEESGNELKLDAIHDFAREGDTENLLKCVEAGVSVDAKDSEGRTPLHWAVDRGHIDVAEFLLSRNADVNLKDNEGQTPLHYAAVCEREAIAELLVKRNAGTGIKDGDGKYPCDLSDSNWPWIQPWLAQHLTTNDDL